MLDDRPLVDAGAGVGTAEFLQLVNALFAFIFRNDDLIGIDIGDDPVAGADARAAGVPRYAVLHAGSDIWRMRIQQRYGLTLHVRAHQGTGSIVIFQEWNTCGRNRNDLFRRNVRQFDLIAVSHDCFSRFSGNDHVVDQTAFVHFVRLRDDVVVFFIG